MAVGQIPILRSCDRARVGELRSSEAFFWADLALDEGVAAADVAATFGISTEAAGRLTDFRAGGSPARRMYVDEELIAFPFWCDAGPEAAAGADEDEADEEDEEGSLRLLRVNVLLHGDFLITMHQRSLDLPELVAEGGIPAGRTERYVAYAVLDGMTNTVLEAVSGLEGEIGELETRLMDSGLRTRMADQEQVRVLRTELTRLRLRIGPERGLFERVGEEIEHVSALEADNRRYFDRVQAQLDRTVDRIDAASQALSNALQVKLNETSYRLTIVATIFLPLSFITGFFGMNFGWMVGEIGSAAAFWLLGVGSMVALPAALFLALREDRA
jgi:magnesium transporter